MNKKDTMMWMPKISRTALLDNSLEVHFNLWLLSDEILRTGEITDKLFKKIGKAIVEKIWFWRSIKVELDEDIIL